MTSPARTGSRNSAAVTHHRVVNGCYGSGIWAGLVSDRVAVELLDLLHYLEHTGIKHLSCIHKYTLKVMSRENICFSQVAEWFSQVAERLRNRASNQNVDGMIPGRAK